MKIPKPLVQLNQLFIVISVVFSMVFTPWILVIPFVVGVVTLLTKRNPIIQVGKMLLRKPLKEYPMEDRDQQLFNQWIATICLGLSLLFFQLQLYVLAYSFSTMVLLASAIALMGYCIGCTIRYRYQMWKFQQSK
ncbi:DUF4395 domain-containing protein [Salipaludibacillus sp. HK11]|uniref:DUF4395 domain-containing protein n=1 Tax=Salipaludibacillus sp. HK11 TaxID=3394320 RepID=UPI0039FD904E